MNSESLIGEHHMFQKGVSVQSSASAHSSGEKKRAGLILIIGHQSLSGPSILVFSAQWTD